MTRQLVATRPFALDRLLADAPDPDAVALADGSATTTFGQLEQRAGRAAAGLAGSGVRAQDRVVYLGRDPQPYLALLVGAAKLNAVAVAVNWRLQGAELGAVVDDTLATVLVVAADRLEALRAVRPLLAHVGTVVVTGPAQLLPGEVSYDAWATGPAPAVTAPRSDGDTAMQIYTSGTTGVPKGVMLSHRNLAEALPSAAGLWRITPDAAMLSVLPLFHVAGIGAALGALWAGARVVLLAEPTAEALAVAVPAHRITNLVLAPVVLRRLLETDADLSSLRLVSYGASPISPTLLRTALERLDCALLQIYGLTETVGTVCVLPQEDHRLDEGARERLRSCGRAIAGVEVRLHDPESGEPTAPGAVGEIWVRSSVVMTGYWNRPQETTEVLTDDGWFRTGDLATQDADGYFFLYDRLRDMVVSGGENVFPGEVEGVLEEHPAVLEAAVVGVPDDRWGEVPRGLVVLHPGARAVPAELVAFVRGRLAHYKCPPVVEVVDPLPRNPSGKVMRRQLREPFWSGQARRVH